MRKLLPTEITAQVIPVLPLEQFPVDPEQRSQQPAAHDTCSMCGKFCAVRSMNKALAGEYIDIL